MGVVMLSPSDLRQKFRIVPGQCSVTLTPAASGSAIQVDGARLQDVRDMASLRAGGVEVNYRSKVWILPVDNLGGYEPQEGDRIDDGSKAWRITGSMPAMMCGTQVEFKCIVSQEA